MNTLDSPLVSDVPKKNTKYVLAATAVIVFLILWGLGCLPFIFGILVPYLAVIIFVTGFIFRVVKWASSPVPFRIPTTCGQQKSLDFIKQDKLESPHDMKGVLARMFLEIFLFRSLFRNTETDLKGGPKLVHGSNKWLWAAALAFHYCFLVILLRHLRFFAEPIPAFAVWLSDLDGLFEITVPTVYVTDLVILGALGFLLLRRLWDARIRYLSLPADYFALFLIIAIVLTGMITRHIYKVDIVEVKKLTVGLMTFHPSMPGTIGFWFYTHFFLICVLLAYFPFSKLMHMPGVFLSPTRNLANNSRAKRHINPWNYPVKVHTYEEYEDEFRDKMKAAGMPLEKE